MVYNYPEETKKQMKFIFKKIKFNDVCEEIFRNTNTIWQVGTDFVTGTSTTKEKTTFEEDVKTAEGIINEWYNKLTEEEEKCQKN